MSEEKETVYLECLESCFFSPTEIAPYTFAKEPIFQLTRLLKNMWATECVFINIYHVPHVKPGSVNTKKKKNKNQYSSN